jgi:hypothetical protein
MILLLFVGQVVAAPFATCSMSMMDMSAMSDQQMEMMDMSSSDTKMDCCEDCQCPVGMCFTQAIYTNSNSIILHFNADNTQPVNPQKFVNTTAISSIYRPPRFC